MKGFLAGLATGLVTVGLGLSFLSLLAPLPPGRAAAATPEADPQEMAEAPVPEEAPARAAPPRASSASLAPPDAVRAGAAPASVGPASVGTVPPAAVPPTEEAPRAIDPAAALDAPDGVEPAPVGSVAPAMAPPAPAEAAPPAIAAPAEERAPRGIDTAPAAAPETSLADAALADPPEGQGSADAPLSEARVLPSPRALAPQVPAGEADVTLSVVPPRPAQPVEVIIVPEGGEPEAGEPAPGAPALSESGRAAELLQAPAEGEPPGRVELEGEGLVRPADAVPVNRFGAEPEPPPAEEESIATEAAPLPEDAPALLRNAASFEPPEEARPLMSVVLFDDGSRPEAPAEVAALPFPASVALDPASPGAADRMAAYRAAGIEVLALVRLPEGAQPSDAEVTLEATFATLPEAVAALDMGNGGLQGRGTTAQQAMVRLSEEGLGVVLTPQGLDSGLAVAAGLGVPAATLTRDIDAGGQDARSVPRLLDDAVRRAGQEGEAVVLGRAQPDTLAALSTWAGERRAQEVALAPVSAVLAPDGASAEEEPAVDGEGGTP